MTESGEELAMEQAVGQPGIGVEKLSPAFAKILDTAIEQGSNVMIRRGGKMVALVVPMTAPEAVQRYLANNPDVRADIEAAREEAIATGEIETSYEAIDYGDPGVNQGQSFEQQPTTD